MPERSMICARCVALLVPLLLASAGNAAGQGAVRAASTGSVVIHASVRAHARMTSPQDLELPDGDAARPPRNARDLCLSSNSLTRSFTISASGHGTDGAFELSDGHRTIGYDVEWSLPDAPELKGGRFVGSAPVSLGAADSRTGCQAGGGAVRLSAALDRTHSGTSGTSGKPFTGVLTLTIAPE